MKNIVIIISTVFLLGLFGSCKKFLEAPYDNRVELNDLDDVDLLLINAYPMRADLFTEILTDNFHHYASTMQASNAATYLPIYRWEDEYSDAIATATPTHAYAQYYKKIYEANLAIESLETASGDPSQKSALLGEALVLRAYNYFTLVNLFSMHYNETTNSTNLGVPLILEVPKDNRELYNRATVQEVYDQIDKDLADGIALMQEGISFVPRTPYRFNLTSVYAFLSRVNLYKGKWDEAARYADLVIAEKGVVVRKMSEDVARKTTTSEQYWAQEIMNPSIHANLLLVNQVTSTFLCRPFGYRLGGFYIAHNLFYSTPTSDYRRDHFSSGGTVIDSVALVVKYGNQPNNPNAAQVRYDCFTMEEVLFNRAESNLRKASPDIAKAMADVEAVRKERFSATNYRALPTPANVEDALAAILAERKLEFLGQGLRWYDIKRLGIQVEHRMVRTDPKTAIILLPNDKRTAIQIPIQAVVGNPLLENQLNPR
ncbi:RagB/SusD family nutrient uptake outer membrane protein [Sphingobacterium hungaricum]|uniref:RagB/SusD family nutrient uptake outer membrane protein n=1 Tax=Sphingobacterium hungaricum TaxID=2082723 RepID=A0A928UW44_9SPHI|nr:RagB/SusD family nutrient uptake outer membrane protein [Sphingobacterium hungaricum]MBE8714325.1 RagB/SusD family nutrient uptake outer membrane protein [Sphingobacterium hungaricum]